MSKTNQGKNIEETADLKPRWYIIQTYVGFEEAVKKSLELKIKSIGLQDKILEIFVPTKPIIKVNKKGEKQERQEKVYPGYIYIKMLLDKETGYVMQNTNYVSRITGTGDFAVPLEEGYVEKLKENLIQKSESIKNIDNTGNFALGDLVQVINGPFAEMQGKVTAIHEKESKLDVILTMFDRDTVVTLDVWEVKKIF
jgi:transcriptional antiterminator NusG